MEDVVPDLWSILTCLIPGGDLSGPLSGTHLRLIIGCIAGTGAIIKPDSWTPVMKRRKGISAMRV